MLAAFNVLHGLLNPHECLSNTTRSIMVENVRYDCACDAGMANKRRASADSRGTSVKISSTII